MYTQDRQTATIYSIFAGMAIIISSLGLLGISLFDIRQRYREIAIRKVNGASAKDLYRLLFRKYITVLIIAFIIAIPLASDKYLYSGFCSKGTCQYRHFYHIIAVGNNHITGHLSIPNTKGGIY